MMAAVLVRSTTKPTKLRISPSGVPNSTVGPPRAEMGEPQPGRNKKITPSAMSAASEKNAPTRPRPNARRAVAGTCVLVGVSMSELDFHRLADCLQWLQVERDADGDFLADLVFGYSP